LRCSECYGEIEGRLPFCPHCGRKMSGLFGAADSDRAQRDIGRPASISSASAPADDRPATLHELAERYIGKKLTGKDAQAAREALEKLNRSGLPTDIDARVIRVVVFTVIGGIIGAALPGHLGFPGLFVGLFLGLRGWKK